MKAELATTLAARVPGKANEILASYGAKQAQGKKLVGQLIALQNKYGEEALKKLMAIHPNAKAIMHYNAPAQPEQKPEEKSNCGGCASASNMAGKTCPMMNMMSSAEGPQQQTTQSQSQLVTGTSFKEWAPLAVGATLFIGAVILIVADKK